MRTFHITPTSLQIRNRATGHNQNPPPKKSGTPSQGYKLNVSKIKKLIWLWFCMRNSSEGLYFYTISFPKKTPDDVAHRIFNSSMTNLRKHQGLVNYLWITERQKNGTIHYHMFVGEFIKIRKFNQAIKAGLQTQFNQGHTPHTTQEIINSYNGVHISRDKQRRVVNFHKLSNTKARKAAINYITKYITKPEKEEQEPFFNLRWHCSRSLSALQLSYSGVTEEEVLEMFQEESISETEFYETEWGDIIYPFQAIPRHPVFKRYLEEQEFIFSMYQPQNKTKYEDFKNALRAIYQKEIEKDFRASFQE